MSIKFFSFFVPLILGFFSSIFGRVGSWYQELQKPLLNPPNWIFGPVWTILYIFLGIVLYRIIGGPTILLTVFATQMLLNIIWSPIFFGLQAPLYSLIVIILLDIVVVWLALLLFSYDKVSFYLTIPYLMWILFATYLNLSIVILN